MVTNDWTQDPSISRLKRSSEEFNFFQLVRLLKGRKLDANLPVNLKFSGSNSLAFKPNFVDGIDFHKIGNQLTATISTNGFHLLGQQGPVPNVFVEQIAVLGNRGQNGASGFLDIFNDRITNVLYEIKKHFSPMLFNGEEDEAKLFAVFEAVSGVISGSVFESIQPKRYSRFWRRYAYLISNRRINYSTLKEVIESEINAEVQVEPASGGWRELGESSQAKLDGDAPLNSSLSLGRRFWSYSNSLELILTFNKFDDYVRHLPSGENYTDIVELLAILSDLFFDIDLKYRLNTRQVPSCELGAPLHLGQTTWLTKCQSNRKNVEGARLHVTRKEMLLTLQESLV